MEERMSEQIGNVIVSNPQGERFRISTIRTFAGGGGDNHGIGPFKESDYANETPWPFETVVFKEGSSRGLYHAAYSTKEQAESGHQQMIETIKKGLEFGGGVKGFWGIPSLTPEEWRLRCAKNTA
jgi:hypothetical protein